MSFFGPFAAACNDNVCPLDDETDSVLPPAIVLPDNSDPVLPVKLELTTSSVIKSLIDFLATKQSPLWNYEDITAKVFTIKSAEQIDIFLQYILRVFRDSLPNAHINERWAQTALQLGKSLVFRCNACCRSWLKLVFWAQNRRI